MYLIVSKGYRRYGTLDFSDCCYGAYNTIPEVEQALAGAEDMFGKCPTEFEVWEASPLFENISIKPIEVILS